MVNNVIGSHKTLLNLLSEQFSLEDLYIDDKKWDGLDLNPNESHKILIKLTQIDKTTSEEYIQDVLVKSKLLGSNIFHIKVGKKIEKITKVKSCVECGTWLKDVEPKHFHMSCPYCKRKGCERCNNTGLHPLASSVSFSGLIINQLLAYSIKDALKLQIII